MIVALILALVSAQTKLYDVGNVKIDTPSAVMPVAEFRTVIAHNEELKLADSALTVCEQQTIELKKSNTDYKKSDSLSSVKADKWKHIADSTQTAWNASDKACRAVITSNSKTQFWSGVKVGALAVFAADVLAASVTTYIILTHW